MNTMAVLTVKPATGQAQPSAQVVTVQYLRGLAALAVVGAHATSSMFLGQSGVDVFFAISGFIMWSITRDKHDIYQFVKHRIVRIVPLYWIATILMGLHQGAPAEAIIKSMLFIPFVSIEDQIWPVLVQGWTLNYEMFFYALMAVSMLLSGRSRLVFILAALAALSCVGFAHPFQSPVLATYTNPLLLEFCFGIIIAELWFRDLLKGKVLGCILGALAILLFALAPAHELPTLSRSVSWGLPSALVLASALSFEGAARRWRIVPLLVLGEASYAIYLFHTFLVKTVLTVVGRFAPGAGLIALLVVASLFGIAVTWVVEKPLLRFLRGGARARVA